MKTLKRISGFILTIALAAAVLSGCSKQPQSTASGDYLNYKFDGDPIYQYMAMSKISQLIVLGGQEVGADVDNNISFNVTKVGGDENTIDIKIKVDSIYAEVRSMQGNMISNPEEVKNKEFTMTLSNKGEESGLEEAAKIEYTSIGGETVNLKSSFAFLFPDMPDDMAKIGYTWVDSDTINMSEGGQTVLMILNSNNTITARENIMGYDCFKIEYTSGGERNASGDTPQGYMSSSGTLKGSGYLYFAIKEGFVVKDHAEQKFDGELTIPTGDSFPMYMDIIINNEIVK